MLRVLEGHFFNFKPFSFYQLSISLIMNRSKSIAAVVALFILLSAFIAPDKLYKLKFKSAQDVKEFFRYTPDRIPFVSAHRGGPRKGYPENCIATFENTLSKTHALLEVDPHYTKDSMIVLMHDPTLNRTSNGSGKISDYTLKELKALKLKDTEGNLTQYGIPTLDEALQWAKGKTLLVLDEKDVPMRVRVKKVEENYAESAAIIMAYNFNDAKLCYSLNKNIVMEVMFNSFAKVKEFDATGVPWKNVVVFVSHSLPVDSQVFAEIHKRGAMCIIGTSRNFDKAYTSGKSGLSQLEKDYNSVLSVGADIIEADLGIEAGVALQKFTNNRSSKAQFF